MTRALQLLVLLMAVLALSLHGVADAHCRVKADAKTMDDDGTAVRASEEEKKNGRGRLKVISMDVPKSAVNTTDYDDNDDEY